MIDQDKFWSIPDPIIARDVEISKIIYDVVHTYAGLKNGKKNQRVGFGYQKSNDKTFPRLSG